MKPQLISVVLLGMVPFGGCCLFQRPVDPPRIAFHHDAGVDFVFYNKPMDAPVNIELCATAGGKPYAMEDSPPAGDTPVAITMGNCTPITRVIRVFASGPNDWDGTWRILP